MALPANKIVFLLMIFAFFACSEKKTPAQSQSDIKKLSVEESSQTQENKNNIAEKTAPSLVMQQVNPPESNPSQTITPVTKEKFMLEGVISGIKYPLEVTTPLGVQTVSADGAFKLEVDKASTVTFTLKSLSSLQTCSINKNNFVATKNLNDIAIDCLSQDPVPKVTISGVILGPIGTVELQMNGEKKQFASNGEFSFLVPKDSSNAFFVTQTPSTQTCTVSESNVLSGSGRTDIMVTCVSNTTSTNFITISGRIEGLNDTYKLRVNDSDWQTFTSSSDFSFQVELVGSGLMEFHYQQPTNQTCPINKLVFQTLTDVSDILISCTTTQTTSDNVMVSGTITGLDGILGIRINGEDKQFNSSTSFSFLLPRGSVYYFDITEMPENQQCTRDHERGMVGNGISTLLVTCVFKNVTVSGSVLGDAGSFEITLELNGVMKSAIAGTAFSFSVPRGGQYTLNIPGVSGMTCVPSQSTVTADSDVSNLTVSCTASTTTGGATARMTVAALQANEPSNNLTACIQGNFTYADEVKALKCVNPVSSVGALAHYKNVEYLELNDSSLISLDTLQNLTRLKFLHLHSVTFPAIDLSRNVLLEEVMIVDTNLMAIDVDKLKKLKKLDLSNNNLNAISIWWNKELTHLKLTNNPNIKRLDISYLPKLQKEDTFPPAYLDEYWVTVRGTISGVDSPVTLRMGGRASSSSSYIDFGILTDQEHTITVSDVPTGQTCTFDGPTTFTPTFNVILNLNCQ